MFNFDWFSIIVRIIVLVTSIPVHEFAHGYAAYKLGDRTAKASGRLTLNPMAHFDPIGSVCMILTGFGWAKPVPIYSINFKNRKAGMAITAAAGPIANMLLSILFMVLARLFVLLPYSSVVSTLVSVLVLMSQINISLAVFNLLPVPPLDGSRIIAYFLPDRIYYKMMEYERYISIIVFILLFTGFLSGPISYISSYLFNGVYFLTSFIG